MRPLRRWASARVRVRVDSKSVISPVNSAIRAGVFDKVMTPCLAWLRLNKTPKALKQELKFTALDPQSSKQPSQHAEECANSSLRVFDILRLGNGDEVIEENTPTNA